MKIRRLIAGAIASALTLAAVPFSEYSTSAVEIDIDSIVGEMTMPAEITAETDYTAEIGGIEVYYDFLDDGTIEIKGVKSQPETPVDLVIPAEIDGTAVTSIGSSAFYKVKNITSLTISEGITAINRYAFADCDDIVSVSLPSTLTTLGLNGLASINQLEHITVAENSKTYKAVDDVLFSYSGKIIYYYPPNKTDLSVYNIPDGVLYISNSCFSPNKSLQSIHIPDTVQIIYSSAFRGCAFKEIRIPESVTNIQYDAFNYIENLKIKILNPECSFYTDNIAENPTFDNTAVIYGKEGSTAQAYAQQAGLEFKSMFTFGVDNFNFTNSNNSFGLSQDATHADAFTDKELLSIFKSKINNAEYNRTFRDYTLLDGSVISARINSTWGGACQGIAAVSILAKNGLLNFSDFTAGASSAYTMGSVKNNEKLRSLIEYYYFLQYTRPAEYDIYYTKTNTAAVKAIKNMIDSEGLVLIGIGGGNSGHAIVGYDYEEGISKTIKDADYDGCIYIYDSNCPTGYDEAYNIYYNTQTYDWTIEHYNDKYNYIDECVSDINILNYKGFFDGTEAPDDEYYKKINFNKTTSAGTLKMVNDKTTTANLGNAYTNSRMMRSSSNKQFTFNFDNAGFFDISIDDKNVSLLASSMSSDYVHFDTDKQSVTLKNSEPAEYRLSITSNEITDEDEWFTYEVAGSSAVEVTMTKADGGFYLEADNFGTLSLNAWNQNTTKKVTLTAKEGVTKIYVYQEDDQVKAKSITEPSYTLGDIDGSGIVDAVDASAILSEYALLSTSQPSSFTAEQSAAADVNADGSVDANDASVILAYYAYASTSTGDTMNISDYFKQMQ